ncbi:hypothetical protein NCS52_00311800 [Fusarium sp. LHS14.1]|nr:hypothetical protein NCS52_00311800 [Fusarium sp. LHS14.1]
MGLNVGQAIGIGVVAGFVGAFILVWFIPRTPTIQIVQEGGLVHTRPETPQHLREMNRREADPRIDSVRWFSVRMIPLMSDREIAEAVEFERDIKRFAEMCIEAPFRPQPPVPESLFDENELVRLAGKPINGGTWSASISNTATRASAVKCFLAQFVFKRIHPNCPPQDCLLPPEVASCYQLINVPHNNPGRDDLLGIWRELVFTLLLDPFALLPLPPGCFKEGDPRKERTLAMVPVIIDALHLKSLRNDRVRQEDDTIERPITGILMTSANSALHLLAQPSEWEAVWEANEPGFIVFPELRFVWNSFTKFLKPAVVDVDTLRPIPSDDNRQAGNNKHADDKQYPEVGAPDQPNIDTEKLPSLEDGQSLTQGIGQESSPSTANR